MPIFLLDISSSIHRFQRGEGRMSLRRFLEELAPGRIATIAGAGWQQGGEAAATGAGWPMGVVRDNRGDLIVADYFGNRIWRIDAAGRLHTFAGDGVAGFEGDGGPARSARFNGPHDLWRDAGGNLYRSEERRVGKTSDTGER